MNVSVTVMEPEKPYLTLYTDKIGFRSVGNHRTSTACEIESDILNNGRNTRADAKEFLTRQDGHMCTLATPPNSDNFPELVEHAESRKNTNYADSAEITESAKNTVFP